MRKDIKIKQEKLDWFLSQRIEVKLELMKNYMELMKIIINEILEMNVKALSGEKHSHDKPNDGKYSRWGYNPGSVKVGSEKLRISVPRVWDNEGNKNITLENYNQMKRLPEPGQEVIDKLILGLSQHDYERVSKQAIDSFGLSQSSISRSFIKAAAEKIKEFEERDISQTDIIALLIDGKSLLRERVIICLGVTMTGEKLVLGFIQSTTENSKAIAQLLKKLIHRGLDYSLGLLCVTDGSKGIKKALDEVFGKYYLHQRCKWHKRENVISLLKESQQETYRKKLQRAYNEPNYKKAKSGLMEIREELRDINQSAVNSLDEGFEETLTLHKLGLLEEFGASLGTTNCIESLNSQIGRYLNKVKLWRNSDQVFRWVVCGLMEAEKRMNKIRNCKSLHL